MKSACPSPPRPILLAATGTRLAVTGLLAEAAPPLAAVLSLPLASWPEAERGPEAGLTALAAPEASPKARLVCLSWDPGLLLPDGRPWAEALGAWRQPVLLLIGAEQLASGVACATTALLTARGVPLAGLIQWGEPWQAEERRRDGLPWRGALGVAGVAEGCDLAAALQLQMARLSSL
jgi:hypothetical protein